MSWVDTITSLASGGVLGGITGGIGTAFGAWMSYKNTQLQNEHDLKKSEMDMKMLQAEAEVNVKMAQVKTEGEMAVREMDALMKSYDVEPKQYFDKDYMASVPEWARSVIAVGLALVDILRGATRPLITFYLVTIGSVLCVMSYKADPSMFAVEAQKMVASLAYVTVTVVVWWFGGRMMKVQGAGK